MRLTPLSQLLDGSPLGSSPQVHEKNLEKLLGTPPSNEAAEISYPDLMTEANVFEWTGVNFGRTEVYHLYLAIKQKAKV